MSTRERLSAEDRKRQICGAAKEVFLSTGFENATMEDIMKAAGLSKGGLYHHYKSTHDILYDIMMMGNEYRNEVIMEFVSANSNLSKKDIIVELLTDKILDRNEYKSLYAMFLLECKKNEKYRKLYERLRNERGHHLMADFFNFCLTSFRIISSDRFTSGSFVNFLQFFAAICFRI